MSRQTRHQQGTWVETDAVAEGVQFDKQSKALIETKLLKPVIFNLDAVQNSST